MEGGINTSQDGTQFEDALRRLNALERKLTGQVQEDITELREKWVQPRVDRVTRNTFKLYQVRENLKLSKLLYVEEEQLLGEFTKVKEALVKNSMDEETFEAAKETCMVLGLKLGDVRNRQLVCYSDSRDLETNINKDIMTINIENKDLEQLDLNYVRCTTPLRELSPTPLEKHKSREPSPFRMPSMKLSTGTTTPGGSQGADPHAYFSRPGSSQSLYGGRGGDKELDAFRAAMEAKQMEDDSPPKNRKQPSQFPTTLSKSTSGNIVIRSASGVIIGKSDGTDGGVSGSLFSGERPGSAMSDMSINLQDASHMSRPGSRMEQLGDVVSGNIDPFAPPPDHVSAYVDDHDREFNVDSELDLEKEQTLKKQEEEDVQKRAAEKAALIQQEAQKIFEEKEKLRVAEEEAAKRREEERKKLKIQQDREQEMKEREERRQADEKKMKEIADKKKREEELQKEKELKKQEDLKNKKLLEKQEKLKKAEELKLKKEAEEKEKEAVKKAKQEEKKKKMKEAEEKKQIERKAKEAEEMKKKEEKDIGLKEKAATIKQLDTDVPEVARKEGPSLAKSPENKITNVECINDNSESMSKEKIEKILDTTDNSKPIPKETPKLDKPKRRLSATKTEKELSDETQSKVLDPRTGSPISILKGGKRSRDASKDRSGTEDNVAEDYGKPLSRKGSLKKSSSFSKRGPSIEKKKISFDEDIDVERFEKEKDSNISTAKEIFAAIADTSLEAGTNIMKHKAKERSDSKESTSGFPPAEPAEWYPPEGSECDNEDELMIILDTDQGFASSLQPYSTKSRSASKERPGSRGSQGSTGSKPIPDLEILADAKASKDPQSHLEETVSTGFAHLDEFERKLAEMEEDLEKESSYAKTKDDSIITKEDNIGVKDSIQNEPIYATIKPKKERQSPKVSSLTDDGYFINKEEDMLNASLPYETEEDVGSECSRNKKVSFAESEERFEFERQRKDSGFKSFTKFFSPKQIKNVLPLEIKQEKVEVKIEEKPEEAPIPPTAPARSLSVNTNPINVNENATPQAFLSAMTGGLIDANKGDIFSSLIRGRRPSRSGSRQSSRQSSGDRSSLDLWSDDEARPPSIGSQDPYERGSDAMSDTSLVNKLKKLKKKKPKHVQPADFDELFARGMAISAQKESELLENPKASRRMRKKQQKDAGTLSIHVTGPSHGEDMVDENGTRFTPFEVYSKDEAFQTTQKDEGIGYAEKVMSYLDDQAQTTVLDMQNGYHEGSHISRGRKKHRHKPNKQESADKTSESRSASGNQRSKSTEERKRSREYTKPEDIKLSPVPIRDLYTGELVSGMPDIGNKLDATTSKPIEYQTSKSKFNGVPTSDSYAQNYDVSAIQYSRHTQGMAPSPGKSFLDAVNGQEVFGASIEGDNLENAKVVKSEQQDNTTSKDYKLTPTTAMNISYEPSAILATQSLPSKPAPPKAQLISPPKAEEPADKGIPTQLVPDKLMVNEEFYEQLRSGIKSIEVPEMSYEQTQEDPESYQKYSHHLGRAEFGTLKKRTSTRTSAATSRDPSGDRLNQQRIHHVGLSRDPSGDRLAISSKISRHSSRDHMRSDSRASNYSGGLPDLEVDETIHIALEDEDQTVQRTQSLLVSGVDMDKPVHGEVQKDMLARREEVLKEIAQHKKEIREAKGWIQNGLMTVVGFGVMVYLQTLESVGP